MNERQLTTEQTREAYVAPDYELSLFDPIDALLASINIGVVGDDDLSNAEEDDW